MKSCTGKINCRPVSEAADNVRVADAIEGDGLVLKILNQSSFELRILVTLKQDVQGFDYHTAELCIGCRAIAGHVYFGITTTTKTVFDVVAAVESALQEL